MRKFLLSIAVISLFAMGGPSVAAPLQVKPRTLVWSPSKTTGVNSYLSSSWVDGSITMPFVSSEPPEIAARINDFLYLDLLQAAAPRQPGKTFALPDGASPNGLASAEFVVARNDERIFALTFTIEGCGAYCETSTHTYNFDARTGRALNVDDLLTPEGQNLAAQRMARERKRNYTDEIRSLKAARASGKGDDDTGDRIAFNQDCLKQEEAHANSANQSVQSTVRSFGLELPAKQGMVLTSARCSNHVMQGLDDVGEIPLALPTRDLAPWLTPYGKALLLGDAPPSTPASAPETLYGQMLHGKVGTANITMRLGTLYDADFHEGIYYYDKYRRPITLRGTQKGNQLELVEQQDDKDSATFILTRDANGFTGEWRGKSGTLPVSLAW